MAHPNDNRRPLPNARDLVQGVKVTPPPQAPTAASGDTIRVRINGEPVAEYVDPLDQPVTLRQVLAAFEAVSKKTRGGVYRVAAEDIFQTIYESLRQ